MKAQYKVIAEYNSAIHGTVPCTDRVMRCIKSFKMGDTFEPRHYVNEHLKDFSVNRRISKSGTHNTVTEAIRIAKRLGIIQKLKTEPISFEDFVKQESVSYFASQLRGNKLQNLKDVSSKPLSTQQSYIRNIWYFNNWLYGKPFEFYTTRQINTDTFKKERISVTLNGLEHFLKLFTESANSEPDFVKMIKKYFSDQSNQNHSAGYMSIKYCAIISYFEKNDYPIRFHYDPNVGHHDTRSENDNATLSLSDLHTMLSIANPLEKAVVLCKFHRGLDSTTMADRFNFQVWEQLVKWFGHTDYENWDLSKCPVPVRITRVKTDYTHTGFLERDAIVAIQQYLNYRYQKYVTDCQRDGIIPEKGKNDIMRIGEPLFLKKGDEPITINWLHRVVPRLARQSGIQKKINTISCRTKHEKTSHELRDLLKSTLIACRCADYVCDLAIGHKVKDSYEKQDKLYPEKTRQEFAKAASKINIFSNVSNYLDSGDDIESIKEQVRQEMEEKLKQQMENYIESKLSERAKEIEMKQKLEEETLRSITQHRNNAAQKFKEIKQDPSRMERLRELLALIEIG